MKSIKAAALAVLMLAAMAPQARAAASLESEILPVLAVMGVMNGNERGELNLENPVTRAEFVKMAVTASALKSRGKAPSYISPYPDVKAGAWHAGYITAARDSGWVTGYLDGTFRPDNRVTLEEAVSVTLKAMGYMGADFAAGFPAAHMALYRSLGLDDGMTAAQGQVMTRRDCAVLMYNALGAKSKSGVTYAAQLGHAVDAQGKINYAALVASMTQGPVLNDGRSVSELVGFAPRVVYRDRSLSELSAVKEGDVLYYIKDVATVWAYSDKVSGRVQAISPSTASPSAVTVSGVTVPLGGSSAVYAFSEPGTVKIGDNVTLLLGAGGQCVFVKTGETMAEGTVYGLITSAGLGADHDKLGSAVQGKYITLIATDGKSYTYPYDGELKAGELARVIVSDGDIVATALRKGEITPSGTVNRGKLDGLVIDDRTEILDFLSARAVKVTADRLDGVYIAEEDVAFCLAENGRIEKLILKNVTGDMVDYAVITAAERSADIMYSPSTYAYVMNGVPRVISVQAGFNAGRGPCVIEYRDGKVKGITALRGESIISMGAFSAVLGDAGRLSFSDNTQFYVKDGDDYYLTSRASASDTARYKLTAYYDAAARRGGQIRIVIAEKK